MEKNDFQPDAGSLGSLTGAVPRSFVALCREFWERFPVWFFYLAGWASMIMILARVDPSIFRRVGFPREYYAWSILSFLFWPLVYYGLRIHKSADLGRPRFKYYPLAFGLMVIPYLLIPLLARPSYLHSDTIRNIFEISQFTWLAVMMIHSITLKGRHNFVTFFVVAFIYGMILENGGIWMGYFAEPNYNFYLGLLPAPLATMMGWSIGIYCMAAFTGFFTSLLPGLKRSVLAQALLMTLLALSLDLSFDSYASLKVAENSSLFWHWNPRLPAFFLGVPINNYVAWFSAFFPFSYAYFKLAKRKDLTPAMMNWKLFLWILPILFAAMVLNMVIMAVVEGGFSGPTFQIFRDFILKVWPALAGGGG